MTHENAPVVVRRLKGFHFLARTIDEGSKKSIETDNEISSFGHRLLEQRQFVDLVSEEMDLNRFYRFTMLDTKSSLSSQK